MTQLPSGPAEEDQSTPSPIAAPRLRVVMVPPLAWLPPRQSHVPGQGPDAASLERCLGQLGIDATIIDPMRRPWNPLHGQHPVLQGIDPLRALRILLFHRDAATVLCVFEGPALVLALLRKLLRFKPRLVMWDIGLTGGWRLRERIQDLLMPRLDAIFVLGSNQEARIAARWAKPPSIRWIGHYTDTVFWHPMPAGATAERYVLAIGDDGGRDYGQFLDMAAELGCACVIRSGQNLALDAHRHRLVRHLRQRLSFPALRDLYAAACVVVVPLHDLPTAGGVTAVLEAAAMGCAMVVSNSTGIRDWLRDGETCLVVPCADAPALASAVRRLLADPALRQRLGQAARAFAERECAPEVFASRLAAQLRG